ncbi:MAG TPA: aminotransferase class V-fold PLP-dependent enzyme [Acidobacteriota bacterium]|nr:aminotransferase class V-fold PLP-dependent enzyme [Acidobacteriota bacterium]
MATTRSESPSAHDPAYAAFLAEHPGYAATSPLDELRATEYARLDRTGQVYLDYTGGSLYAASQLRRHHEELSANVFGNPHSNNPTSQAMTERVERTRARVLEYFNAPPGEYLAIFTPNASGALREAGEAYPFAPGGRYLLTFDNHNSVNGIREFARAKGAAITYAPLTCPDLRIDRAALSAELARPAKGAPNLFAFPAQSNFSGVQHPLEWIDEAHAAGWDVLLDAAAFVPANRLDLARWKPDLVALSFYKMFGYPTGVGALLMRTSMLAKMRRPWFAGGTIQIATVQGDGFYRAPDAAAYEDGTVDYLSIPAVEHGLAHLESVGVERVHERVRCLTAWLLARMGELRHENGRPMVRVHGPAKPESRGGTIAFNFLDPAGHCYDIRRVEELANEARISLRTGCFCNPGAGEATYGLTAEQIGSFFHLAEGMSFDELRARIRESFGLEVGAIRVSVGIASNFADVQRFLAFAATFRDRASAEVGAADPRDNCGAAPRDSA